MLPEPIIQGNQREIRYLNSVRPATAGGQLLRDQYASHQQMDAENRLHQIALIRPKENIDLLNQKYLRLQNPRHARPILPQYRDDYVNTLYDQMGNYVQERSGLYHTDVYNPNELVQAIPELDNAHKLPQRNNESYLDNLLERGEHIQQRSKPTQLEEKAIGDYQVMRVNLKIFLLFLKTNMIFYGFICLLNSIRIFIQRINFWIRCVFHRMQVLLTVEFKRDLVHSHNVKRPTVNLTIQENSYKKMFFFVMRAVIQQV